ncbi:ATP/GTP-binding protein [Kitasatospora sp. NPDC048540]|uniref:GTP-binding protein n=1 Tax=Kitasatospora sp. NPDC048540 TaxID=3155634 RepID=UPI00340A48CE
MPDFEGSDPAAGTHLRGDETVVKLLIGGGLGAGKTTLVGTLSEIRVLSTEETMTRASEATDDLAGLPDKTTTTVAMDFGRITLDEQHVLYLFGAPGQPRFRPILQHLARGALGALVLVDTSRLEDAYPVIGEVEGLGLPYAVAVNRFPTSPSYPVRQLRSAMALPEHTPLLVCDARQRASARTLLIEFVEFLLTRYPEPAPR